MRTLLVLVPMLAIVPAHADETNNKKSALCPLGDLNKDGIPDLAVASRDIPEHIDQRPGGGRVPLVRVRECVWLISGKDGALLRTIPSVHDGEEFGSSLANAGDLDGDGADDLVVGSVPEEPLRRVATVKSTVRVHSGASGNRLFEITADHLDEPFGYCVAGLGDIDGDGRPDFAASAPFGPISRTSRQGNVHEYLPGYVRVFSGRDAALIYQLDGKRSGLATGELFGTCVASIGDFDGDGAAELAVSAPGARAGKKDQKSSRIPEAENWEWDPTGVLEGPRECGTVFIHDGRSGRRIASFDRTTALGIHGWTLAPAGDVDADGKPDLLVGTLHRNVDMVSGATWKVLHHRTDDGYPNLDPYGMATSLASIGDVDRDGAADFVIGANEEFFFFDPGSVDVISGRTGARIWRFFDTVTTPRATTFTWPRQSLEQADEGYDACGCGDVNGDGTPDVAVVTQFSRELLFLSGKDRF